MGLNNVQLTSGMLKSLYPQSLVATPAVEKDTSADNLSFLGKNAKNISIIHQTATASVIDDKDLSFLTGILTACNLTLADVAIINNAKNYTYNQIQAALTPQVVLLLGVGPLQIGLSEFNEFAPTTINAVSFLNAPSLNEISSNKAMKSSLWQCLKQIFNL